MPASQEIRNHGKRIDRRADSQLALGHIPQKTPHSDVHEGVLELLHQEAAQKTRIRFSNVRQPPPSMILSN